MTAIDAIRSFQANAGSGVQDVILVANIGDSQASAAGLQATSLLTAAGEHSRSIIAYNSGTFAQSLLAHKTGSRIGWHSMAPAFANRLYELTGLGTLWIPDLPVGGLGMMRSLSPAGNWDFSGTPSAANGNRLFLTDGSINLDTVMPRTLQYIANAMPGFRVVNKILIHFDGYTEVASGFESATCTEQEVIDFYADMYSYWQTNWGFEKLIVIPPGFVGDDEADYLADTRRWDLARAAAQAACNGTTIINGCDWLDEFAPLVVDGNGDHISGTAKSDGSHYDGATNNAIGRTVAETLAGVL